MTNEKLSYKLITYFLDYVLVLKITLALDAFSSVKNFITDTKARSITIVTNNNGRGIGKM